MLTDEISQNIESRLQFEDGRVARSRDSRLKIVRAFLRILSRGHVNPSAEEIAIEAKVGLRTFFRRFKEMELLYLEVADEIQAVFAPEVVKPWHSDDWREQLFEMLARKAVIYEKLLPFIFASRYHRIHSEHLRLFHQKWLQRERDITSSILPFTEVDEPELFYSLEVALSSDTWLQYREHLKLSQEQAQQTMKHALSSLLKQYDDKTR